MCASLPSFTDAHPVQTPVCCGVPWRVKESTPCVVDCGVLSLTHSFGLLPGTYLVLSYSPRDRGLADRAEG